jgi:hypothetical protein
VDSKFPCRWPLKPATLVTGGVTGWRVGGGRRKENRSRLDGPEDCRAEKKK